jgi:uncharacterized protein YdeI (YjbR/CyaY-like superfamily)
MEPTYFASPQEFRAWLERNHQSETEILVGFHKVGSGRPSMTWPESVDQALCFGWIDGVRRRVDDGRYTIRFTPRKSRSTWSAVNVKRMGELMKAGLVHPDGVRAFEGRTDKRSGIYSYEQREHATLPPEQEARFKATPGAWEFFTVQPAWYRKAALWWVVSGKKEETRDRRLDTLIADSAAGRPIKLLDRKPPPKSK